MVKFCDSSYPRAVQSKSFSLTTLREVNEMKRCGIVLMFLVFALPTLAATPQEAACAQEGIAQHYIGPSLQFESCTLDPSLPLVA
jgi:hypothetical protein